MVQVHEMPLGAEDADYMGTVEGESSFQLENVSDVESELSDDDVANETFLDRIRALKDIVPLQTRSSIKNTAHQFSSTVFSVGQVLGHIAWVLTTSAMVLVVPLVFEMEKDHAMTSWEKEQQMQQQGAQQVCPNPKLMIRCCNRSVNHRQCHFLAVFRCHPLPNHSPPPPQHNLFFLIKNSVIHAHAVILPILLNY